MSRVNFHSEHEREILSEAYREAVSRASLRNAPDLAATHTWVDAELHREPLVVTDPRFVALLELLQKAAREVETKSDSDMAQHYLEFLSVFASMLSQEIRGNTRFVKKAA